jgi:hypothetical protein
MRLSALVGMAIVTLICAKSHAVPSGAQTKAQTRGVYPRAFKSEEASFEAAFPGAPAQETMTVPTPEGPQLRHVFRYADDDGVYFLVHTCMPPPSLTPDPDTLLDMGRDSGLRMTGGTLVSERPISVDGHPGRDLIEKSQDGDLFYSRIVVGDHGTFYSVNAGPRSAGGSKKALAFLHSFRILPATDRSLCKGGGAVRNP